MLASRNVHPLATLLGLSMAMMAACSLRVEAQAALPHRPSRSAGVEQASVRYRELQRKLAQGWNTWDVNSMTTHVLLPEGLAIHVGFKHNATLGGDDFLAGTFVGRGEVFPGTHAWDGSYTDLKVTWKGHNWRVRSAHDGSDLVLLVMPLGSKASFAVPATVVFSIDFLWDLPGTALKHDGLIETRGASGAVPVYCTCAGSVGSSTA